MTIEFRNAQSLRDIVAATLQMALANSAFL
jgi:hypothetical protein